MINNFLNFCYKENFCCVKSIKKTDNYLLIQYDNDTTLLI